MFPYAGTTPWEREAVSGPPCYLRGRDLLVPTVEAEDPGTTRCEGCGSENLDALPVFELSLIFLL